MDEEKTTIIEQPDEGKEKKEENQEIRELRAKIAEIEKLLPIPHIVTSGENHYMIAMDFLRSEVR